MKNNMKRLLSLMMALVMVLTLCACGSAAAEKPAEEVKAPEAPAATEAPATPAETVADKKDVVIRVGCRVWTEQYILMELMAYALEQNGYTAERVPDIGGSTIVHDAMMNNEIDLAANYSGSLHSSILGYESIYDKEEQYRIAKEEYLEKFNIVVLDESEVNNSYGLFMRKDVAAEYGIATMSDLAKHTGELVFANHGGWLDSSKDRLIEIYGGDFEFKEVKLFDGGLRYASVKNREADVSTAYTTDGELYDDELILLAEDGSEYPYEPYYVVPFIRGDVLEANPEIADIINGMFAKLTAEAMIELNYKAAVELEDYDVVAQEWYDANF